MKEQICNLLINIAQINIINRLVESEYSDYFDGKLEMPKNDPIALEIAALTNIISNLSVIKTSK